MNKTYVKIRINKIFGKYNNEIDFDNKINIFIGENGIGKSTTINILYCLLEARYIKLQDYYFESIKILENNNTFRLNYEDLCLSQEVLDMLNSFLNKLDYRLLYKLNKNLILI